ncbi:MAG: hypothetical protein J6C52_13275 [Clostridia bacterium]|nr:hypothetical protein [Clostridia bacterium]
MKKTRFINILLALLLMASVSCGEAAAPADDTTASAGDNTAAATGYNYPDVDYGGYEFRILNFDEHHGSYMNLDFSEATGEKLDDAVYERNRRVEEKLNFKLVEIEEHYATWNTDQIALIDKVTNSVLAGDDSYDAAYVQPYFKPSVLTDGTLMDLNTIPELHTDADYWDAGYNESFTFDGKLYVASGPLHLMAVEQLWCVLFNEDMTKDYDLALPYQLVRDGKWTMDKMYEYASAAANLNGDASFTYAEDGNCVWGIAGHTSAVPAMVYSADLRFVSADKSGFTVSLNSERLHGCVDKLIKLFDETSGTARTNTSDSAKGGYVDLFRSERALFTTCEIKTTSMLRDMDATYGMLPLPKYEESQDSYTGYASVSIALLGIPATQKDTARAGTILDALTWESNESVLPLLYDVRIGQKGLRNEESIEMFNIIRSNCVSDFARTLGINGSFISAFTSMVQSGDNTAASLAASHEATVKGNLDTFIKALDG